MPTEAKGYCSWDTKTSQKIVTTPAIYAIGPLCAQTEDVEDVGNTSFKSYTKEMFSHMFLNYHVSQVSCEVDMLLSRKKSERKIFS